MIRYYAEYLYYALLRKLKEPPEMDPMLFNLRMDKIAKQVPHDGKFHLASYHDGGYTIECVARKRTDESCSINVGELRVVKRFPNG